jgi:putative colanic acid biosynthesis glycosyltransferase
VLSAVRPSLIHLHHIKNHALSLLARLAGTGIPVIVSLHDYYFLCPDFALQECPGVRRCDSCYPARFHGPAEYQHLRRALFHASLRKAAAIVAASDAAASLVREVYPDLKIAVIPHGIRPIPRLERKPRSKIRFGMLGNVNGMKGIEVMLKAWPLVAPAHEAELHIHGAGEPVYAQRCAALGIHYHGPYIAADLPRILSGIDVGVLPTQAPETFSYALSEFFAGGVPVVGSNYGALSERIVSGVNGLRVEKDDVSAWASALSLMIRNAALRERIAQGVKPPDSIGDMAAHYASLYREVIERYAAERASASLTALATVGSEPQPQPDLR